SGAITRHGGAMKPAELRERKARLLRNVMERVRIAMQPPTLRERKRLRTKQALQTAALRLIEERGYDATTVEEIAAAADGSPRTFFCYFASKEDVIVDGGEHVAFLAVLASQPAAGSPIEFMRGAVRSMGAGIDAAEIPMMLARSRLIFSTPALLARSLDQMQQIEDEIATILADRYQRPPD